MSKPITPPSPAAREKHFKAKAVNQKPNAPSQPPQPMMPPRIVKDPLVKGK